VQSEQSLGVLNQRMGYIEMPFEVSYKLLDNKFGVEVIGGMSTLFLNKNEVFLEADGMNMKIGEATNLNPFHLSTNFGVGFNYGFLKNFQARIEPTFKYQLNTFTRDSQNFKPYIFGIYTGVSYRF
jgi:long-subunit fatty acid transport protein